LYRSIALVDSTPDDARRAMTPKTILVSLMRANKKVGTIEPITEVSRITRERGVLLHWDAAQFVGKIATRVDLRNVDLLTIAGQKLYAPKGVGALYVSRGTPLDPLIMVQLMRMVGAREPKAHSSLWLLERPRALHAT
jgi:cysteine sulfinate desulfinase/cysteine desulfurase-like protein